MSIATMEEEIIDVNVRFNQAVRQRFSRRLSGIALDFQRPGQLLQDWTIVCWLDMAVDWYQ